ncbi:MAG: hypothetical protein ACRDAM_15955 [Casimicrobium sp.]
MKTKFDNAIENIEFVLLSILFGFGFATGAVTAIALYGKLSRLLS